MKWKKKHWHKVKIKYMVESGFKKFICSLETRSSSESSGLFAVLLRRHLARYLRDIWIEIHPVTLRPIAAMSKSSLARSRLLHLRQNVERYLDEFHAKILLFYRNKWEYTFLKARIMFSITRNETTPRRRDLLENTLDTSQDLHF